MSRGLKETVLEEIRECAGEDKAIAKFLLELILEEAEHPGFWQYKELYKKKLQLYTREEGTER